MTKINKKALELYILPIILVALLLAPHLLSLGRSYVDVEPMYVNSASEIADHGLNANLSEYFTSIANPIFTPMILAASYKLFGESPVVSRLTILFFAFLLLLFLYLYLRRKEDAFESFVLVLLVIVNPLFIIFSHFVYTDIPFIFFSSVALILLFYKDTLRRQLLSSVMLGLSLATKYVTIVLFPVALLYTFVESKISKVFSRIKLFSLIWFDLWYFVLAILVSLPVISIAFMFQGSILSPHLGSLHLIDVSMYIPRFFSYLMWLGLFIGLFFPIYVLDFWKRIGKYRLIILVTCMVVLTSVILYFIPISSLYAFDDYFGEMNLSGLEDIIAAPYLSVGLFLALVVAETVVAGMVYDLIHTKDKKIIKLFLWIIVPILLMPVTRGAQRYMLSVLVPLSFYLSLVAKRMYLEQKKPLVLIALSFHCLVFLFTGIYAIR